MSTERQKKRRKKVLLGLGWGLALILGFTGGIVITFLLLKHQAAPPSRPAAPPPKKEFSEADRLRYRTALERLRYQLLAPSDAPPFESVMTEEKIRAALAEDEKKDRLLREYCELEITDLMIEEELLRMKEDYERPQLILKIAEVLDQNPAAIVEFWVKPILVDRYLRACVSADPEYNASARREAEQLRQTFLSRKSAAPPGKSLTLDLASAETDPEDKEALAPLQAGQLSPVIESPFDFHFYFILARDQDSLIVKKITVEKPAFETWLKKQP